MNRTILFGLTIVALLLTSSFISTGAFAATKTFAAHQTNIPLSLNLGPICSSNDNIFAGRVTEDITIWDNNKADTHIIEQGILTDSVTGKKVGEVSAEDTQNSQPVAGFPFAFSVNIQGACDGSGATSVFTIHEGVTVDQQGNVHIHQ